jgi:Spy/CpxP family protein refolding chaperone
VKKLITTTLLLAGLALAGLALAGMAAPASAQMPGQSEMGPGINLMNEGSHRRTVEDWQDEQEREKAYKSGMKKIPDQKVKSDPWGAVRTTPPAASPPTASNQRPAAK